MEMKLYRLTNQQKGIWYTEKIYPNTGIGTVAGTFRLKTSIEFEKLEEAINIFIKDNDAMRIRIVEKDGEPFQYIEEYNFLKIEYLDFSNRSSDDLYKWEEEESTKPIKYIENNLFEFINFKVSDSDGGFLIKTHHMISDAWSMSLLCEKILAIYTALVYKGKYIADNIYSYLEHIKEEDRYLNSKEYLIDEKYWRNKLEDFESVVTLKDEDLTKKEVIAKRKSYVVEGQLGEKLRKFCEENKVSEYTVFFATLGVYTGRVKNMESMFIGTSLLNRLNKNAKNTVGMYASAAVPVKVNIKPEQNFLDLIMNIYKEIFITLKHQRFPYEDMSKIVRGKDSSGRIFDIVLNYQNAKIGKDSPIESISRWNFNAAQIESLIINISDRDNEGKIILSYDYIDDFFYEKEIEFLHEHLISTLTNLLENPNVQLKNIDIVSEKEKDKILNVFNNGNSQYDKEITVHELFEKKALEFPDRTAVVYGGDSITYNELNKKANRLARKLREEGVNKEDIIAIILEKSIDMIVAILAILKSGGVYLPILPQYPKDRIEFMLKDSNAKLILTSKDLSSDYRDYSRLVCVDDDKNYLKNDTNLDNINNQEDLLYIIYTSGSTGKPKGVMLKHRNLVRLMFNNDFMFSFSEEDVWTMFHSYCFDFSVWEMYGALLYGGKLVIVSKEENGDITKFLKLLKSEKVTVLNQTPTVFYNLIDEEIKIGTRDLSLRYVVFGGEALNPVMLKPFREMYPDTLLINMYGITETTVHVTFKDLKNDDLNSSKSNIGKALPTLKVYILDDNLKLLPIGVPGELCVAGDGVARGYLNRPELSEEKFIINPFNKDEMMYKSGDLGRFYGQGEIEYLGRIDNQVKIRGFRVELGEIERVILSFSSEIKNTLVMAKKDNAQKNILCAYVVSDTVIDLPKLRAYMANVLPEYMIPPHFVFLDKFPLTVNGKIDRKKLPEPVKTFEKEYIAPESETEKILCKVFAEVLNISKIGVNDNIFHAGGDSITVIQLLARLYQHEWNLTATDFYKYPTASTLAGKIESDKAEAENIENDEIEIPAKMPEILEVTMRDSLDEAVLLTGVTGFLGAHLLKGLIDKTNSDIYCLVRGKDIYEAEKRAKNNLDFYFNDLYKTFSNRIKVINGDVGRENLGLNSSEYKKLGNTVKSVIHAAALVKYYGDYEDFENVNVFGTRNIIKLAQEFNLKLNHISTVGVSGSYLINCDKKGLKLTEEDLYVGQDYKGNAYVRSKFEAENLILKAQKNGLATTIFRMGNLTGRFSDGAFQRNLNDNAFYNIIRSIVLMAHVPESLMDEEVEFTPIDLAAESIIKILSTKESTGRIFHITNTKEPEFRDVLKMLNKLGIYAKVESDEEFNAYVMELSNDAKKFESVKGIILDMSKDKKLSYDIPVKVCSQKTLDYLKKSGFEWPDIDLVYIEKIINYLNQKNFFEV